MTSTSIISIFLILFVCAFWGFGNALTGIALQTMPTMFCLGMRSAIAAFLYLAFFRHRIAKNIKKSDILPCLLIAAVSTTVFLTAMLSLKYCEATTASFLISIAAVFSPPLAFFVLGTKIDKKVLLPIVVIIVGLYFLCGGNGEFGFGFGEIIGIVCSLSTALLMVLSEKYLKGIDELVVCVFQSGFGAVSCLALSLIFEDFTLIPTLPASNWYFVIYLGVFASFAAFLFQNIALKHLPSVYVSILYSTESLFSALFAFILLHEYLSLSEMFGAMLVLVGTVAASLIKTKSRK